MNVIGELAWTLWDTLESGDLVGHLAAWWEVVTGQVTPDDPAGSLTILGGADEPKKEGLPEPLKGQVKELTGLLEQLDTEDAAAMLRFFLTHARQAVAWTLWERGEADAPSMRVVWKGLGRRAGASLTRDMS